MPRSSGGAQNLRRGDRVRIKLNGCYRHYLDGLEGKVTCVLHHSVVVALDNDPVKQQKVIAPAGRAGPAVPNQAQRTFQFHEVERIET
jgi:hypothetical protein